MGKNQKTKKPKAIVHTMYWGDDRIDPKTDLPVPNTSVTFLSEREALEFIDKVFL